MLFHSPLFMFFFTIVFILYWSIPHKFRWILLLLTSYYFYMSWNVKYIFLIFFSTLVSYLAALMLEHIDTTWKRKLVLYTNLVISFGILFIFKYFNFFSQTIFEIFQRLSLNLHPVTLNLLLPVGISFYTFQTISYVIDVYRKALPAERHFGKYAAFISFFPQLVAGPIERASNLLPQLNKKLIFDYDFATYGLKLMAWGYFKKLVIADNVSSYVQLVYDSPQQFQGFSLVLATLLFSLQIYCDFSGYSDIAIGASHLLGIRLTTNFRSPYFSKSLKEFWNRWHISLSTWFKDYVYIPLGGNRVNRHRKNLNLLVTFLLSGLWHGANWTFMLWGLIHGIGRIIEETFSFSKRNKLLKIFITYAFCSFSWIFFVSASVTDAWYVVTHLFTGIGNLSTYLYSGITSLGIISSKFVMIGLCIILLGVFDAVNLRKNCIEIISKQPVIIRYPIYMLLLILILYFKSSVQADFVYFQF